jgi:hypothetical protein
MPNNHIPEGTVLGALSFAPPKFEFQPWSVYAGIPLRFVRPRNRGSVVEQVKRLTGLLEQRATRWETITFRGWNDAQPLEAGMHTREINSSAVTDPGNEPVKQQSVVLSILLPVRNEGINLRIMVKLLKAVVEVPHELLIVYDFPEDESIPVIRAMQKDYSNLQLVHNTKGQGVVNAIRAGVDAAVGD